MSSDYVRLPTRLVLVANCGKEIEADAMILCGVSSVFRDMLTMPDAAPAPSTDEEDGDPLDYADLSPDPSVEGAATEAIVDGVQSLGDGNHDTTSKTDTGEPNIAFPEVKADEEDTAASRISLPEDADTIECLLSLAQGNIIDIPHTGLAERLPAAIDKYDMPLLRQTLLLQLRHVAATYKAGQPESTIPIWMAFIAASWLDDRVIMVDCLSARQLKPPVAWSTLTAAAVPFAVYAALVRAWDKSKKWDGMIVQFVPELESGGETPAKTT